MNINLHSCKAWTPPFAEVYVKSEVIDENETDGNLHSDNPFPVSNIINIESSCANYINVKTEDVTKVKTETYEGHDDLLNAHLDILPVQCEEEAVCPCTPLKNTSIRSQQEKNDVQLMSSYQKNKDRLMDENVSSIQAVVEQSSFVENIHRSDLEVDLDIQNEHLFSCNVCSYKANSCSMLSKHIMGHTSKTPSFDKSTCKTSPSVCPNGQNVTAEKKLSCEYCSFKTMQISHLKRHTLIHTGEKAFACEFCSYKSNQKANLKFHRLVHTAEKPFACGLCSFKTTAQRNLNNHILTHTGNKPFACELCSYKAKQKSHLKIHLLKHTAEKPYTCEFCSYKAIQKSHLKLHLLKHTTEKVYACDLCSYKTKQKSCLNRHILIHSGDKPFACEFCSYKANRKFHLNRHLSIHTE